MPRRYTSALRQEQAQRTRESILDAGRALITGQGYARTSMRAIADRAGIAVDTVYQHFRSKPALLKALLDIAVGGDEDPVPVAERAWVKHIAAHADARAMLTAFADAVTAVHENFAPLLIATAAAAAADEDAAELWRHRRTERLHGMRDFAELLRGTGHLRPELGADEIRDRLYALASPELYGQFVLELRWPADRYSTWLAGVLVQQLTP